MFPSLYKIQSKQYGTIPDEARRQSLLPTMSATEDGAADDTMTTADAPPPLPLVIFPPPMITGDTQVPVADTNNNTAAASTQLASDNGLINFDGILAELQSWQSENNGSLEIPRSHPVS